MKINGTGLKVFIKSLFAPLIEILLLPFYFLLIGLIKEKYLYKDLSFAKWVIVIMLGIYFLYLLLGGASNKLLNNVLLRYKYEGATVSKIIAICFFYSLCYVNLYFFAKHNVGIFAFILRILWVVEFGSCFISKLNTRLSLFLLRIQWCDY